MRRLLLVLFASAIIVPVGALADPTVNQPPPPQMDAGFQYMQQAHAQVQQLQAKARLTALNALSPAHRALLAEVAGQLAIAPNPDVNAAARTIDSALTQTEGRNIASISSSLQTQSQQVMEAARQQMMAANPQGMPQGGPVTRSANMVYHGSETTDPGMLLLQMSMGVVQPAMGTFMMRFAGPAPH
jgi:hypothetical protein